MLSRLFLLATAINGLLVAVAPAATTVNWTGASGNWSVANNWTNTSSGHTVPANGDTVKILPTDGVDCTITYDYTGPAITLNSLNVTLTNFVDTTSTATFSMAANTITSNTLYIGNSLAGSGGRGTFNQ